MTIHANHLISKIQPAKAFKKSVSTLNKKEARLTGWACFHAGSLQVEVLRSVLPRVGIYNSILSKNASFVKISFAHTTASRKLLFITLVIGSPS